MSVIYEERHRVLSWRESLFLFIIFITLGILFLRLWYLQVVKAEDLQEKARRFQLVETPLSAPRSLITDRHGELMAGVKSELVVMVIPSLFRKNQNLFFRLANILEVPEAKLRKKIEESYHRPYLPTPVHIGIDPKKAILITEDYEHFPGVEVESQPMRIYNDSFAYSHLMGYVWTPNEKDVKRFQSLEMKTPPYVGKSGIELQYDFFMMGKMGAERMEVNVRRQPLNLLERVNPIPGKKVKLSIDLNLQRLAAKKLEGYSGAIVALEPSTGQVLALASGPSYDINQFSQGISYNDWKKISEDSSHPLVNRGIEGRFPPGSTFKPATALSAALMGMIDPNEVVVCKGLTTVGPRKVKCAGYKVHGPIKFEEAIAQSCNVYFAHLGLKVGVDALRDICNRLGFSGVMGIDLPYEKKGIVPTEEWIARWRKPARWYLGDTINFSFGQGDITLTPIQLVCMISLIANKGVCYHPSLLYDQSQTQRPSVLAQISLEDSHWSLLHSALHKTTTIGNAKNYPLNGIEWAAKTGSPEYIKDAKTHSAVVCFAPLVNPKIALVVMIERSGHGAEVAVPVARDLISSYLSSCEKGIQR